MEVKIEGEREKSNFGIDDQLVTLLPGETVGLRVSGGADLDPEDLLRFPVLQSVNTLAHPGAAHVRLDAHEGATA